MPKIRSKTKDGPGVTARSLEGDDHLEDDGDLSLEGVVDGTSQSVVKMKLNRFCEDNNIRRKLNAVVKDMNVLLAEAYTFGNFHVIRLLQAKQSNSYN